MEVGIIVGIVLLLLVVGTGSGNVVNSIGKNFVPIIIVLALIFLMLAGCSPEEGTSIGGGIILFLLGGMLGFVSRRNRRRMIGRA